MKVNSLLGIESLQKLLGEKKEVVLVGPDVSFRTSSDFKHSFFDNRNEWIETVLGAVNIIKITGNAVTINCNLNLNSEDLSIQENFIKEKIRNILEVIEPGSMESENKGFNTYFLYSGDRFSVTIEP